LKDFSRVKVVSASRRLLKARVSKIVGVIRRAVFSNGGGPPEREAREKEKQPAGGFRLRVVRLFLFSPNDRPKKRFKIDKNFLFKKSLIV
jgi:hypothetical protein